MEIVTGGAGFIGSHLVDALSQANVPIHVVDDLSAGKKEWIDAAGVPLTVANAGDAQAMAPLLADAERVWHLAADPEVRRGAEEPSKHIDANVDVTVNLLEAMRKADVGKLAFTSTSTIYGTASVMPTPEDYGPLYPISVYGGCKLACEALISAYCGTYGMQAQLFRFANVVGPRSNHGVTYDFVHKLRANPQNLEILGDGTQHKSYVHVADTVSGMQAAVGLNQPGCTAWNIGSTDGIPVTTIADIVSEEMGLKPTYSFTGGAHGGAGWAGDVKHMGLAVDKIVAHGWQPSYGSADAVRDAARSLISSLQPMAL